MPRTCPALDIRFVPEAETALDLRDRLVAGLDDFQPTAIEEAPAAWRVFFDSPDARDRALAWLRGLGDPRIAIEPIDVEDEDWARRSQADLRPVRAGRIVVTPPWSLEDARREAGVDDMVIVVVPSTGFGTGHHASTRLCLALLQGIPVRGRSVLDIGTGSGVLALAAARMGASAVTAVDNDSDAIDAAMETIALNPIDMPFRLQRADFRTLRNARADIVIANLTGNLLRRAAADVAGCLNAGGDAIVSGVLAEEQAAVVGAFEAAGAKLRATKAEDEWVGLHFRGRQGASMVATADSWIERLGLEKHSEGGWFREMYRSAESVSAAALPSRFAVSHPFSTAIYFLLRGKEFSALHRLKADEVWHFYAGSPLTLHVIAPDGRLSRVTIGPGRRPKSEVRSPKSTPDTGPRTPSAAVERAGPANPGAAAVTFQAVVPAGHWFGATLDDPSPDGFALAGCTVAPGFIFEDFELGDRAELVAQFPQHRGLIERLTRGG